ncbi:type VI secretion system-associated FHA domain protein TagH [Undibacterium sp. Jales W-56]|uniref:type VI secretion system-associated FHA domain protein TagH n=1 Tax=Undibacterium sp. Jales W-56 TaxID=2897325 RepID=UPI0021D1744A|nr:type VI secretion system-associated FHA domain protein TagH [Undibacterium sp. Jales W-56]MCU6432792.1 type VI secretion system-associated FHA domain protein TagH [Undibacterium sp. Jales W-56]
MIKIAVVSYNDENPLQPLSAIFGADQATIGRSDDNFFVLPDPKHFVSRSQAKVWSDGTRHQLINLSLANPIQLNGKEIEAERAYDIHAGDQIQIGLYLLSVCVVEDVDGISVHAAEVQAQAAATEADKLSTISGQKIAARPAVSAPLPKQAAASAGARSTSQPPQFLLRPEAGDGQSLTSSAPAVAASSMPPAAQARVAAAPFHAGSTEPAAMTRSGDAARSAADADELLQAFLKGAGLPDLNLSSGLTVELMETLGKLMATSVKGTMGLISQRALVKREVNAELTMVVLRKNNPLKFFPDSDTVLTQMLRKKMPGFMAPEEAMEDAFLDLQAHQLGVVAGMKAAMDALTHKLQPSRFEQRVGAPGFFDSINPARRKALMWDHFSEVFNTISLESKDEFQSLFGKEFLAAYEKEVERVRHDVQAS